jgi:hypothetical protein
VTAAGLVKGRSTKGVAWNFREGAAGVARLVCVAVAGGERARRTANGPRFPAYLSKVPGPIRIGLNWDRIVWKISLYSIWSVHYQES